MVAVFRDEVDPSAGIAKGTLQQVVVIGGEHQLDRQASQRLVRSRRRLAQAIQVAPQEGDQAVQPLAVNVGLGRVDQRVAGGPLGRRQLVADTLAELADQVVPAGQARAHRQAGAHERTHLAVGELLFEIDVGIEVCHGTLRIEIYWCDRCGKGNITTNWEQRMPEGMDNRSSVRHSRSIRCIFLDSL